MTKLITIELENAAPLTSADSAQFQYLGQLLQIGFVGESQATMAQVGAMFSDLNARWSDAGKKVFVVNAATIAGAHNILQSNPWDVVRVIAAYGDRANFVSQFDADLGQLVTALDEDAAIMILTTQGTRVWFLLAVPQRTLRSGAEQIQIRELEATLAELSDIPAKENAQGNSLLPHEMYDDGIGYTPDDEAIVYDRLAGLGYIG